MRRFCLVIALALFAHLGTAPVRADAPKRHHDITTDDLFTLAGVGAPVHSPDGKYVAYPESRWRKSSDDRKTDLWVVEVKTGKARRLTSDRGGDHAPQWSPDSKRLYFAGSRKREGEKRPPYDGKTQVWRIDLAGGEPSAVTRVEGGVGQFQLARDGRSLYYQTEHEGMTGDWKELKRRFKDIDYGHGVEKFSRIWKLDLENWRTEKLIDDQRSIREFAVSPDGWRVAMITTPDDKVVSFEGQSRVDVFDAKTKKIATLPDKLWRKDAPSPYGWLEQLAWSADSQALAFTIIFDAYPAEILVAEWKDDAPTVMKLRRPEGLHVRGYGTPIQWRGKSAELCFLGEEKARVRLCSVPLRGRQGELRTLTPGDVVVWAFHVGDSGEQAVVAMTDPTHFRDLFLVEGSGKPRRLTNVNPQTETWKLPQSSIFAWKGAKGDTVEGILELPPDYKPGQRLPLVVDIHGGPTTANYHGAEFWIYSGRTWLPAKGFAVLSPNYRGSTGYGDRFLTDLVSHDNDIEVDDMLKGVDALVKRGIADPDRLGVMGWSNGGYLTNCLISKTTRFKAASSGAGIIDTVVEWAINDEPAYMNVFKQGLPWSKPDNYRKSSPSYSLDKIRTPTLIHVGGADERCPPGNSHMLHRALKEYVKVPTELLVYPGEPHGLTKYKNHKAKMEWDLAWFDRYILGK
jgi:dipeptidyl aminopeptidase/acylaminoacyl peptidase